MMGTGSDNPILRAGFEIPFDEITAADV